MEELLMNKSIRDILSALGLDADKASSENSDIKVIKARTPVWFARENGKAYVCFEHNGEYYKTILRGKHQALNAAFCVEIAKRMGIPREKIDKVLVSIPFDGRFETLSQKPLIIFDTVESSEDMKNFAMCVYDYFGRKVQASMTTSDNIHPEPFRRLVIADVFYPELALIKQNVTIIFTKEEFQKQYLETYNGVVKTLVMDVDTALSHATKNFPEHKIFIIGGRNLYKRAISHGY